MHRKRSTGVEKSVWSSRWDWSDLQKVVLGFRWCRTTSGGSKKHVLDPPGGPGHPRDPKTGWGYPRGTPGDPGDPPRVVGGGSGGGTPPLRVVLGVKNDRFRWIFLEMGGQKWPKVRGFYRKWGGFGGQKWPF